MTGGPFSMVDNSTEKKQMERGKTETKYDRKMEARKKQEKKDRMEAAIMRTAAIVIGLAVVLGLGISIVISTINKNAALKDPYLTVGEDSVTKLEYDYYYNSVLNSYSSYLSYLVDTSKSLDEQMYSDTMTWKDYFDQMAIDQMKQTKALADDAAANHFTYDITEDYNATISQMETSAESLGYKLPDYFKLSYGNYATQSNVKYIMEESILAGAYYNHLIEQNTPSDQEVQEHYQANVLDYDKVDYRSFVFPASVIEGSTDAEISASMTTAKNQADAMMEERKAGADFRELALKNAEEENKSLYESADSDGSLAEGYYYYSVPSAISSWLYEDGRMEGDLTVIEDADNHQYYVVEFINRYFDEADNENIAYTIAEERTMEHVNAVAEGYQVTDIKGELHFLTLDQETLEGAVQEAEPTLATE